MASVWSEHEDDLIRDYYPEKGPTWKAWQELLPTRSVAAITQRAMKLGVAAIGRPAARSAGNEGIVMDMLEGGMPPSEIDSFLHLRGGTSHEIIVGVWRRDRERYEDMKRRRFEVGD